MRNLILNPELVFLNADLTTSEECIRFFSAALLAHGFVKSGYAEYVVEREKKYPTGLPGNGLNVAIPHTTKELALRPAIGVIVPRAPVPFDLMGAPGTTLHCALIMPIVVADPKQQVEMLRTISRVFKNGALLQRIVAARSSAQVLEAFCGLEIHESSTNVIKGD